MTPRFILITTAAILLAGCDRRSAEVDPAKAAQIAQERQAEQAANDKIHALEERLNAADQQKAADREAELADVKVELAQIKKDKEAAADRIRVLQAEADRPAPVAEAPSRRAEEPSRQTAEPRGEMVRADLERVEEEDDADRDREPVYEGRVVPETQRVSRVEQFYKPLDQYGDWIQTDDYGYVFRPEVASRRDWRPYTDGHWIHTGHGWTWQSNEEFGWATYHYGRWARVAGTGWVWVPGREWGPGWVSWRRGKEDCGWAPLPPESRGRHSFTATVDRDYDIGPAAYVFIALSNFGARSYAPVVERPEQNVTIINKTVNVTNITYNNTDNRTVVYNGGPSLDVVRARSKQPVENVQVNFAGVNPAAAPARPVNIRQGNTFQVAAPPVAAASITAPARVKERLGKPQEDKGWAGLDPAQAQTVKQNIAATSVDRPKRPAGAPGATLIPGVRPAIGATPNPAVRPVIPAAPNAGERPAVPATPNPQRPVITTPATPNPRPNVAAPETPRVVPRPMPDVPEKAGAPEKPAGEVPRRVREIPAVQPTPAPATPSKPAREAVELPKVPEPQPATPKAAPEIPPKTEPAEEMKKPREEEPRKPATPPAEPVAPPVRVVPKTVEPPATPAVRQRPRAVLPTEPSNPSKEAPPVRPKTTTEDAPARVRPVMPEKPTPPREPQQIERRRPAATPAPVAPPVARRVAPVPEAPVARRAAPVPEAPVRKVVPQPERPPQERVTRTAPVTAPAVERPRPQPPVVQQRPPAPPAQRPPAPVVQRAPQPQAPPTAQPGATQGKKSDEESDKKRKKKEEGQ